MLRSRCSLVALSLSPIAIAVAAAGSAVRLEVHVPAAAAPVRSRLQRRQGERCRAAEVRALSKHKQNLPLRVQCAPKHVATDMRRGRARANKGQLVKAFDNERELRAVRDI